MTVAREQKNTSPAASRLRERYLARGVVMHDEEGSQHVELVPGPRLGLHALEFGQGSHELHQPRPCVDVCCTRAGRRQLRWRAHVCAGRQSSGRVRTNALTHGGLQLRRDAEEAPEPVGGQLEQHALVQRRNCADRHTAGADPPRPLAGAGSSCAPCQARSEREPAHPWPPA